MPDTSALRDVAALGPVDGIQMAHALAVLRVLSVGDEDFIVVDDRRADGFVARFGPNRIFGVHVEFPKLLAGLRFISAHPTIALADDRLDYVADFANCGRRPLAVQDAVAHGIVLPH